MLFAPEIAHEGPKRFDHEGRPWHLLRVCLAGEQFVELRRRYAGGHENFKYGFDDIHESDFGVAQIAVIRLVHGHDCLPQFSLRAGLLRRAWAIIGRLLLGLEHLDRMLEPGQPPLQIGHQQVKLIRRQAPCGGEEIVL
jgi:hypothetical protein